MKIDWGDIHPSSRQRQRTEQSLAEAGGGDAIVGLRRAPIGYAACVTEPERELWIAGRDLDDVVARAALLLGLRAPSA